MRRRLPVGAEVQVKGGVHFRVWAPGQETVGIELGPPDASSEFDLEPEPSGYFSGFIPSARAGSLYRCKLSSGSFPDPVSRFQPDGPHGPSQVIDPRSFSWTDVDWRGRPEKELVIYEMHLGTFTPAGTWRAAAERLPDLARTGITMIELMPVAEFPGRFGWGYDGVDLFAPTRLYGSPDDFRAFVNQAHALGLMVILDVVYNHMGPEDNYLTAFSPDYFTTKYTSEWGAAPNFDDRNSSGMRELVLSNVRYWIEEFHLDGLRLDATQQIFDESPTHILTEIVRTARAAGPGRQIYIVGENEPQNSALVRAETEGGHGLNALWNDDFHHAAMVAATGRVEAYYSDYQGRPQEFISAAKYGCLYQGQFYRWQSQRRGTPMLDLSATKFVAFLQNHDQVANSLRGLRLHQLTAPGKARALTALLLLGPATPMLFQGQEYGASQPFLYFAEHNADLNEKVSAGRRQFLRQFRSIACAESQGLLTDPSSEETFLRCKLDWKERSTHSATLRFHEDLLRLRREDPGLTHTVRIDGAVLSPDAFLLRYFSDRGDRLLLVNLGTECRLDPAPEPLLAPLPGKSWGLLWSSENPVYGGDGTPPLETTANWMLPGNAAVLLKPDEYRELQGAKLSQND